MAANFPESPQHDETSHETKQQHQHTILNIKNRFPAMSSQLNSTTTSFTHDRQVSCSINLHQLNPQEAKFSFPAANLKLIKYLKPPPMLTL